MIFSHDHLPAHHLALGVGVVVAGVVVAVLADRGMGREPLQPLVVILVQPPLIVVDEHRGGDVQALTGTSPCGRPFPVAPPPSGA